MKIYYYPAIASIIFSFATANSQVKDFQDNNHKFKRFSVTVYGTFVSSGEIQLNPKSNDPIEKDASIEIDGAYGYGGEFEFRPKLFDESLIFFISTEVYKLNQSNIPLKVENDTSFKNLRTKETITMYPIETGVKWNLPVGFEKFKIYIGGGAGIYMGNRVKSFTGITTTTTNKKIGFSIIVLAGIEYEMSKHFSIDGNIRFREANFDNESSVSSDLITIESTVYRIPNPIYSRFLIDGVRMSAGLKINF